MNRREFVALSAVHNSNVEISIKREAGNRSLHLAVTEVDTAAVSGLLCGTKIRIVNAGP